MSKKGLGIVITILFLIVLPLLALAADPVPPADLDGGVSSRREVSSAKSVNAQAGNVTALFINATVVTKTWQGYYGNVTGTIVLMNSNNMSMYDWEVINPEGEVYAVNDTISDWSGIKCLNFSANSPEMNLSSMEASLGLNGNDPDGVNETFTLSSHPDFWVGSVHINANECKSTKTYVNDGEGTNFYELLLLEPTKNIVVYTGLINSSVTGFDGSPHDFQLLVGVNGHGTSSGEDTYYFYVELF